MGSPDAQHIIAMRETAHNLKGQQVTLTTARGRKLEGELVEVRQASCCVGIGGPVAYGGIVSIVRL